MNTANEKTENEILGRLIPAIPPADENARQRARADWNRLAKPLGSLGLLEDAVCDIAALTGKVGRLEKRVLPVFCADNGVVAQGVTQCGSEVTATVAVSIAQGKSSVCQFARVARADVIAVDVGMLTSPDAAMLRFKTINGTNDMTLGPAMKRADAEAALCAGFMLARGFRERGYDIAAAGEMGIGNTTTSSAVVSALLDIPPERVTGRGAGLSSAGLERKLAAIKKAIAVNRPDKNDPVDVLAKVGGLDIAALTGFYLGCAHSRMPVLLDGFISSAAALAAVRINENAGGCMLASHVSAEPAGKMLLEALGKKPLITAGMRLGEGTGAVAALPLLDMALEVFNGLPRFEEEAITPYVELK